jgi:hypothetical protein
MAEIESQRFRGIQGILLYDWDGSKSILGGITDPSSRDLYKWHYSWKAWLAADLEIS